MNFDNYKFRCSGLGNIVTASGKLTEGAKTYLKEIFIEEMYGIRKEAYGKALDKGIACEQDGFELLNKTLYPGRFIHNVKTIEGGSRENEYIKGTCDTYIDDIVYDIKNAWDRFTFAKAELTHIYQWQIIGYMWLYDLPKGAIFYCLNNLPEHMMLEEEKKMFYFQRKWTTMDDPDYIEACDQLRKAHNYNEIPIHERFKVFFMDRDPLDIEKAIQCIGQAREYLNKLMDEHNNTISKNIELINASLKKA